MSVKRCRSDCLTLRFDFSVECKTVLWFADLLKVLLRGSLFYDHLTWSVDVYCHWVGSCCKLDSNQFFYLWWNCYIKQTINYHLSCLLKLILFDFIWKTNSELKSTLKSQNWPTLSLSNAHTWSTPPESSANIRKPPMPIATCTNRGGSIMQSDGCTLCAGHAPHRRAGDSTEVTANGLRLAIKQLQRAASDEPTFRKEHRRRGLCESNGWASALLDGVRRSH